jgi:hypothetical protein
LPDQSSYVNRLAWMVDQAVYEKPDEKEGRKHKVLSSAGYG